ncbi:hypothetical protein [Emaravirus cordylinae]|uniref:Uncharacterized protein n=1 Tax=Emaravirus cordylinae TaxID=2099567 RepID=A0A513PVW6_9VIRU|nr:hypothetical protein KM770_s5gp1 [Emaravirus cordylinae]QAB47311.1 hypothetical protein [Emaravirus cordylinae]
MMMKHEINRILHEELFNGINCMSEYVDSELYDDYQFCLLEFDNEEITIEELKALSENPSVKLFNRHLKAMMIIVDFNGVLFNRYKKYFEFFKLNTFTCNSNIRFMSKIHMSSQMINKVNLDLDDVPLGIEMNKFIDYLRSKAPINELHYLERINNMLFLMYKHSQICSRIE